MRRLITSSLPEPKKLVSEIADYLQLALSAESDQEDYLRTAEIILERYKEAYGVNDEK